MNPRLHEAFAAADACAVFYGTSLTRSGGWVEIVGSELRARYPALCIVNAAEGGRHSGWGREHFAGRVLAHRPTVVFIEFAINDAVARFGLSVADARAHLEAMLDALVAQSPRTVAVLQIMNPAIDRPAGHDGHRPHLAAHEQMWREVAHARGLPLVDHAPAWAALLARGTEAFRRHVPDGLHPNAAGYAGFMLPALRQALGLTAPANPVALPTLALS
ncbi:MAG TPA: SGNH/GDSL hydrolase family protein [Opitutaceae bacterium]